MDCSGCFADLYEFSISSSQALVISLESLEFDALLRVLDSNGVVVATDDDSGAGTNLRLSRTFSAGTYRIEATTFAAGEVGAYTLSLQADTTPTPTVMAISVGQTVSWTLTSSDGRSVDCSGCFADLYEFSTNSSQALVISLDSLEFDALLRVLDSNGVVVAIDDDSGAGLNSLILRTFAAGTYQIEASTFSEGKTGSYELSLRPPPTVTPIIIPQIANSGTPESGGFFTIFNAVNVTSGPATVTVEFFDSQGAPMSMPILGGEFVGFFATLQPEGYVAVQTVPNGSATRIGYALITSTPEDSVAVNATFVQLVPGRPPFMAGIPVTNTRHSTANMPYVSDGGFTPSLALVSRVAQTVTLTARSGVEGAERCSTTVSFGTDEHMAFLLRDVLPCTATGEGSLEIRGSSSTPELSGIGFLANDEGAFVTQPIWSSTETITNP